VSGQNDATVTTVLADDIPRETSREWIHARSRFIQQDGLAVTAEGDGNGELAFHSTAQVLGERVALLVQGDVFDTLADLFFGFCGAHLGVHSLDAGEEADVFLDCEHGEEAIMLQADSNFLADGGHFGADVFAADGGVSFGRGEHACEHADRGGLSSAIVSEQGSDLITVQ